MYQDYKDLLSAFHAHGVRYLIVGGYAVVFHAQPRFTKDIARVLAHAEFVWDDREEAREWMNKPHRELQDSTPLDASRTELGARRVEDVLDKLFYGLPV